MRPSNLPQETVEHNVKLYQCPICKDPMRKITFRSHLKIHTLESLVEAAGMGKSTIVEMVIEGWFDE